VSSAERHPASARKLFGTDGIRGVANTEPVTCETALRLGQALAGLCRTDDTRRHTIIVGRDTRLSGGMLESAVAAGICSAGVDVLLAGVLPTPGVAFLTRSMRASAGAVISASHNPFEDNGIKFFASTGFKLADADEQRIETAVLSGDAGTARPTAAQVGRVTSLPDAAARYAEFLKSLCPHRMDGLQVAIDCGHGAAYRVGPEVFRQLGAQVFTLGVDPDGTNINRDCGALHVERLQETVRAQKAHIGVALDGDADRIIVVDECGDVVDGDELLAMMAGDMLAQGTLRHATVVGTVMSNMGLEVALRARGARLVRTSVGDRYVVDEMRRHGYNLGGEQSGHLIFLDQNTTGDGLLAGLAVVRLMIERRCPVSQLKQAMSKFPQQLINVAVKQRRDLDGVPPVRQTIERITAQLNERGRVLVRYSGTEPLVRVMVEGEDAARVRAYAEEIAAAIRTYLAV
jgi:phosphoglucosamine mutase